MKKAQFLSLLALLLILPAANAQQPEYLQYFDPAKGFKPATANLTAIVLQLAGSLECYGSPEPYIRHVQQEHARVARLYEQKTGKTFSSRTPPHMTDVYIDCLVKNWNTLAPLLELDSFTKEIGRCIREGTMGTRLSGTIVVGICNEHQKQVVACMANPSLPAAGFDQLKFRLAHDLEFDRPELDTTGYEIPRRDAVSYAAVIDGKFKKLSQKIDASIKPEKASMIKDGISGIFIDLGYLAQSELEIAILEMALRQQGS